MFKKKKVAEMQSMKRGPALPAVPGLPRALWETRCPLFTVPDGWARGWPRFHCPRRGHRISSSPGQPWEDQRLSLVPPRQGQECQTLGRLPSEASDLNTPVRVFWGCWAAAGWEAAGCS